MDLNSVLSFKKIISIGKVVRFPHFETIFRVVFLIIFSATLANFNAIFNFRAHAKANNITIIDWSVLRIVPAFWVLIYILKYITKYFTIDYVTLNLNDKYKGQERQLRIKKSVKWIYDVFHYSATSIFAWYFFRQTDWFPTQLGGQGQCSNLYGEYPAFPSGEVHKYLTLYYLLELASHSYAMLELIIVGKEVELKFWEYQLHHFVACTLIFFSLTLNILKLGAVVLVIHDTSDAFLSLGRAYGDFKTSNKYLVYLFISICQISWIYTRMYVFPTCVISHSNAYLAEFDQTLWDLIWLPMMFQTFLLNILLVMHFYWTCFMLKVVIGIFKLGKYKNVYDNKENKLDEELVTKKKYF